MVRIVGNSRNVTAMFPRSLSLAPQRTTCRLGPTTKRTLSSNQRKIHGTASPRQSTTNLDFTHSSPSLVNHPKHTTDPPSWNALRTLFTASAIPMIGFGFMDNVVMIQAGQYIDSTLGVQFGLATMTAAAAGQVVSDVSGVVFGGTLERFLVRMKLIRTPDLTTAQRQLTVCRNVSMLGAVMGVIVGCALGATTLLLVDLEARDRLHRAVQLREIVSDMIDDNEEWKCKSATVFLGKQTGGFDLSLLKAESSDQPHSAQVKNLEESDELAHLCSTDRVMLVSKAHLCAPVIRNDEVVAVIEFQHDGGFTEVDKQTAKVIARHVAIFMERLAE